MRSNKLIILALALALALPAALLPQQVRACSGWIDCWLGMTERTEVRTAAETDQAIIAAQAAEDIARVNGEQAEQLRLADAEVERVKQEQYATEAARDIAIAQTTASIELYKASLQAVVAERVESIQRNSEMQIATLHESASIAIEGITQVGLTERTRIIGSWAFYIILILAIAVGCIAYLKRVQIYLIYTEDIRRGNTITEKSSVQDNYYIEVKQDEHYIIKR